MNEWARRRKRNVRLVVLLALIVLVGVPYLLFSYKKPTCSDGKLNGDETGVDCGGSCQLLCRAESLPMILKGDPRVLTVATSTYEVVAVVSNPNITGEVSRAKYVFKLYTSGDGVLPVKTIEGETYVPKNSTFVIFEGPFNTSDSAIPMRATFEWQSDTPDWQKNLSPVPEITIVSKTLSQASTSPRLDAVVENDSLSKVSNIELIATVSDASGNIFAASRTFLDDLDAGTSAPVIFTWPRAFERDAFSLDISIRIFPDRSFIR